MLNTILFKKIFNKKYSYLLINKILGINLKMRILTKFRNKVLIYMRGSLGLRKLPIAKIKKSFLKSLINIMFKTLKKSSINSTKVITLIPIKLPPNIPPHVATKPIQFCCGTSLINV